MFTPSNDKIPPQISSNRRMRITTLNQNSINALFVYI